MNRASSDLEDSRTRPHISVVVYVREAVASIGATLRSLSTQEGIESTEVLVADASRDGVGAALDGEASWIRHLRLEPCTMPEGKAHAIAHARGEIIAILDAHDRAAPGWLLEIERGFTAVATATAGEIEAIGGTVVLDAPPSGVNGAAYLFEYGAFAPPLAPGPTPGDLPGNNIAYRRRVFDDTCADLLETGFYKPFYHARIRENGGTIALHPAMRVLHRTPGSLRSFCTRRYHYGRCFGAMRVRDARVAKKILYTICVPAVPLLLMIRHFSRASAHRENRRILTRAMLGLCLVCFAWGVGEWFGTWFGAARSCRMVY